MEISFVYDCFISCFLRYDTQSTERNEQNENNKLDPRKNCKICFKMI